VIYGVDVGASGAVAVLDGDQLVTVVDMPTKEVIINKRKKKRVDAQTLFDCLRHYEIDHAFVETVSAMPNQGVASMFAFGQAVGIVEGVIASLTDQVTGVRPQEWKKHFGLGNDKDASRQVAMDRFPDYARLFKRKKDDGRAEAVLIGLWGYECHLMSKPSN
jgi:crossover junction endodeoxyribonuclease RuvC